MSDKKIGRVTLGVVQARFAAYDVVSTRKLSLVHDDGFLKIRASPGFTAADLRHITWAGGMNVRRRAQPDDLLIGEKYNLLTSTTKMTAWSWNLPAGPTSFLGTCPASALTFLHRRLEWVDLDERQRFQQLDEERDLALEAHRATWPEARLDEDRSVCNICYALKGRYGSAQIILKQMVLYRWAMGAIRSGRFAPAMVDAIRMARSKSLRHGGPGPFEAAVEHPDYFRIHDSGDYFSPEYFDAWIEIASAIPEMIFWSPTRTWATPFEWAIESFTSKTPPNLVIRPSMLHRNERPMNTADVKDTNMAAGTGVGTAADRSRGWVCPAYKTRTGKCQFSSAPYKTPKRSLAWPGGCRMCWEHPESMILYPAH